MPADLPGISHYLNQLIRQILRMGGHKPDPADPVNFLYHLKKFCKGTGLIQSLPIGIHILSKQHDLHYAVRRQRFDFFYDVFGAPASLPSPDIRHNTITAEVIAAEHNVDP